MLNMKLLLVLVHRTSVLPLGFLLDTPLQTSQSQRELRTQLLQTYSLLVLEHISVASEKDPVTLVVKSDHLTTHKLGLLGEQGLEKSSDSLTESGGKVVEDKLRNMISASTMANNLLGQLERRDGEVESGSSGKMDERQAVDLLLVLVDDNQVCVISLNAHLGDLLHVEVAHSLLEF